MCTAPETARLRLAPGRSRAGISSRVSSIRRPAAARGGGSARRRRCASRPRLTQTGKLPSPDLRVALGVDPLHPALQGRAWNREPLPGKDLCGHSGVATSEGRSYEPALDLLLRVAGARAFCWMRLGDARGVPCTRFSHLCRRLLRVTLAQLHQLFTALRPLSARDPSRSYGSGPDPLRRHSSRRPGTAVEAVGVGDLRRGGRCRCLRDTVLPGAHPADIISGVAPAAVAAGVEWIAGDRCRHLQRSLSCSGPVVQVSSPPPPMQRLRRAPCE